MLPLENSETIRLSDIYVGMNDGFVMPQSLNLPIMQLRSTSNLQLNQCTKMAGAHDDLLSSISSTVNDDVHADSCRGHVLVVPDQDMP